MDIRAVDTARVLAADAVQKVGNGHPGTAMSLAPVAYLLYQQVMRVDPADPNWLGRDRFVLSCGHSSLTQYIQLYLSGYGLELDDLKALRTWVCLEPYYSRSKGPAVLSKMPRVGRSHRAADVALLSTPDTLNRTGVDRRHRATSVGVLATA